MIVKPYYVPVANSVFLPVGPQPVPIEKLELKTNLDTREDPSPQEKESIKVLQECIDLQLLKGADYQSVNSSVKQADYYPSGCKTILEIMHAKMLRLRSLIESDSEPNFEGIEDSAKDLCCYASFLVSYARGKMDGQDTTKDYLNRKRK